MIDIAYKDKLKALKEKFKGDTENLEVISEWEKKLKKLNDVDRFMNLATTKEIVKTLKSRLIGHFRDKAFTKGLTSEQLAKKDERIEEIQYILALFMPSFEEELESLNQDVEAALNL